jgi:GNAT superfamily N-acetyltransferase
VTTTATVTVRSAGIADASTVLAFARRFIELSPFAHFVEFDEESARQTILQALSRGIVFVMELPMPVDRFGNEQPPKVVGAIMGILTPWWFSRESVAAELGWWVDPEHRGHGDELRRRFEGWAKQQRAPVVSLSDVKLDDSMPNGTLYERAGYEVVERAWLKRLRAH